eukprot:360928-Chlamydomonas_euryale.AAC.2
MRLSGPVGATTHIGVIGDSFSCSMIRWLCGRIDRMTDGRYDRWMRSNRWVDRQPDSRADVRTRAYTFVLSGHSVGRVHPCQPAPHI